MQGLKRQLYDKGSQRDEPTIPVYLQILIFSNLFIYIYDGFWDVPNRKILGAGLSIILMLVSFWKLRNYIIWTDVLIPSLFFGMLLYARLVSHNGRISFLNNLPYAPIGFSIGVTLKYMKWPKWSFYSYMIIALLPFLYIFFVVKADMENFAQYIQMNRNSIPLLLIINYSLFLIAEVMNNKKYMPLIPIFLVVVCSFYSKSRAGLLLSSGLLLLVVAYNVWQVLNNHKHSSLSRKMRFVIGLGLVALGMLFVVFLAHVFANSRFATQGFDGSRRGDILKAFIQEITWKNALTGFIPDLFSVHSRIDASFAMAFSYLGIMSIVLGFAVALAFVILWKHSFLLFCVLGVHTVYGFVEWLSPMELGDIVLIPLLMIAFSLYNPNVWVNSHKPISLIKKESI
jgi:hypothetical protein